MVDCGVYVDGQRLPGKYTHAAALNKVHETRDARARTRFVWIGLHEPDAHQMQDVADVFGLHALAVEDAVHAHQRPKLERYDDTLFLVLKTVNYVDARIGGAGPRDRRDRRDHDLRRHGFRGHGPPRRTRRTGRGAQADGRRSRAAAAGPLRGDARDRRPCRGPLPRRDRSDASPTSTASRRWLRPGAATIDVEPIYLLKREVVELRRCVNPLSVAFQRIQTDNKDLISKEVRRYLRDVADHHIRGRRPDRQLRRHAQLAGAGRAGPGRRCSRTTTCARSRPGPASPRVPTMVAGIYGMNFDFMPELNWTWGYPTVMTVMVLICVFLYFSFRNGLALTAAEQTQKLPNSRRRFHAVNATAGGLVGSDSSSSRASAGVFQPSVLRGRRLSLCAT